MTTQTDLTQLSAVAARLREMREIMGWTAEEMAEKTEVSAEDYRLYEAGQADMPLKQLVRSERPRALEMLCYGFRMKDVSLAGITHFTRHRIQSLIVPRPMDALVKNAYVLPATVRQNPEACRLYTEAFAQNARAAREFLDEPALLS